MGELTQDQMEQLVKGYEAMPVALAAVTEQLNKMNSYLGSIERKAQEEDEDEKKEKAEKVEKAKIEAAVKSLVKGEALVTGEAEKIPTPPQKEEQDPIEAGTASGKPNPGFSKAGSVPPPPEDEEEKEDDKKEKVFDEMAVKAMITKAVKEALGTEGVKLGMVKAGVQTKTFGVSDTPIVKAAASPITREDAVNELSKLSYRQLAQLEMDTKNGTTQLPF